MKKYIYRKRKSSSSFEEQEREREIFLVHRHLDNVILFVFNRTSMERSSKDDRREEEEIKSKILTRGKHSKSFCCPTNALVQPKTRVEKRTRKKMALCGSGRSADSARRCIGFGALVVVLLCCFSSFDATSIDECFQGPNFWCLNRSTEVLCNFTNQTVGLCGFTNKRCQIKTGKSTR